MILYLTGNRKPLNVFNAKNGINLIILRDVQLGCDVLDRLIIGERGERQED